MIEAVVFKGMNTVRNLYTPSVERRAAPRTKTTTGVLVYFGSDRGVFAGMVLDISAGGAKIQLGELQAPRRYSLSYDNFLTVRQCRRIWKKDGYTGLAFEGAAEYPDESSKPA
jgi:PilZ domain